MHHAHAAADGIKNCCGARHAIGNLESVTGRSPVIPSSAIHRAGNQRRQVPAVVLPLAGGAPAKPAPTRASTDQGGAWNAGTIAQIRPVVSR